ncbi:MAG: potassium-transporting ATPase subunit KdpA [Phycisphaerales bacterium]
MVPVNGAGWIQIGLYLTVLLLLVKPLGWYMARVYEGRPCGLDRVVGPIERLVYRLAGVDAARESGWARYAIDAIAFAFVGFLAVYGLQRTQGLLPLNPQHFGAVSPDSSLNTAISFITNTNWQGYGGETTMSMLTQMLGLGVQNFLSAAMGMAVLAALVRGLSRRSSATVGNFWVDLVRGTLYILLPLSLVLAVALLSQGVVQTFQPYRSAKLAEPIQSIAANRASPETPPGASDPASHDGAATLEQFLPLGPVASQVAIKQLGTNGGGYFNVNSAHPFENPTPLSNLLQALAILLVPAALCFTFGEMVRDRRQGWALLAAMVAILVVLLGVTVAAEQAGNPALAALGVDQSCGAGHGGGNMEGKEVRFGVANSALWAVATTAASNGSVNSMHDSFTPLGEPGLRCGSWYRRGRLRRRRLGALRHGHVRDRRGLRRGPHGGAHARVPGQEDRAVRDEDGRDRDPCAVRRGARRHRDRGDDALGVAGREQPGPHGFSQILYALVGLQQRLRLRRARQHALLQHASRRAWSSAASACWSRRWRSPARWARKTPVPATAGTLPTHTPLFVAILIAVVIVVGRSHLRARKRWPWTDRRAPRAHRLGATPSPVP